MAPSPRKAAPTTFNQTWDETDTAFFDPSSLPVSKVPRAWEHRQHTKVQGDGKQRKVWRRYGLRTRQRDTTTTQEDEEENDSRARAVKRQQQMSPKAIEKTAAGPNGKKRGFRATRWDRRKSVLPRKKRSSNDSSQGLAGDVSEIDGDSFDATEASTGNSCHSGVEANEQDVVHVAPPSNMKQDPRSTFTFTVGEDKSAQSTALDSPPFEEDAILAFMFQSPVKPFSSQASTCLEENVHYLPLPKDDDMLKAQETTPAPEATVTEVEHDMAPATSTSSTLHDQEAEKVDTRVYIGETNAESHAVKSQEEAFQETDKISKHGVETPAEDDGQGTLPALLDKVPASDQDHDAEMSEIIFETLPMKPFGEQDQQKPESALEEFTEDEDFTEASLQLDIQRELDMATKEEQLEEKASDLENNSQALHFKENFAESGLTKPVNQGELTDPSAQNQVDEPEDDIAMGLTLGSTKPTSPESTPRKIESPSLPPMQSNQDDATMTFALDDDTALLKDFLTRAAASKAEKAANISRRESLQNRRDSDVVRHALASPRTALEDKDPNSPSKYDNEATLDLSQTLTLGEEQQAPMSDTAKQTDPEDAMNQSTRSSRRSTRARSSRLPAPSSTPQQNQTPKINVRRADGGEPIVLKKTDAANLALLTRTNTRKNKSGAVSVSHRLLKLKAEASRSEDNTSTSCLAPGKKNVQWDEQLAYFQEGTDTLANMIAEAESIATPDELSLPVTTAKPKSKSKTSRDKNSTPKIRRVRGLGTANGTPGKGLLAPASLLPDEVQEEHQAAVCTSASKSKSISSGKSKKMPVASDSNATSNSADSKLPTLDIAPVGIESTAAGGAKERKSRLATPRKVKLPQPSAAPEEGKENSQRAGIASPPKRGLPASSDGETGLPRRRAKRT